MEKPRWKKRKKNITAKWPAALLLLSGALKAGLTLNEALEMLLKEAPEPLRGILVERMGHGGAWLSVQKRIERLFMEEYLALPRAILLFSHESGGKTAALIETCADLLAKKMELREKAAVLTAEGRMSAWVVGASPFALLFFLSWVSPDFTRPLFVQPAGRLLLVLVALLVAAGLFLVQRAVRVEP